MRHEQAARRSGLGWLATILIAASLLACSNSSTNAPQLAVRQLWDEYLTSRSGLYAANAGAPSSLWSSTEQEEWPMYDLAGFYVPDHAVPEVLSVSPVNPAPNDSAYRIVTRFWPDSSSAASPSTAGNPLLTMTVYAHREGGRWVLANALPYLTSAWQRESSGRIAYRVAPSLRFDPRKADLAAQFVDSLATAFGVQAPSQIDYFVAESVDQALEILGVVFPERFGDAGGFSKPVNRQVFSGIPALGENYRHELAHVVLMPLIRDGSTTLMASEGVPTWLGGTAGRDYQESVKHMVSLLNRSPQLTLNVIVDDMGVPSDIRNAAGAVLASMVYETAGTNGVREYLRTPAASMRPALERLLQRQWVSIVEDWQRRVEQIGAA